MQAKKIFLASDHGGVALKDFLRDYVSGLNVQVCDCGTGDTSSVDYPDYALNLIQAMKNTSDAVGVLVCTTGIGMSIAANRFDFIRAALVQNTDMAKMSRAHNDANVIVFGAKYTEPKVAQQCLDVFLNTSFEGGRHARRVEKLTQLRGKL